MKTSQKQWRVSVKIDSRLVSFDLKWLREVAKILSTASKRIWDLDRILNRSAPSSTTVCCRRCWRCVCWVCGCGVTVPVIVIYRAKLVIKVISIIFFPINRKPVIPTISLWTSGDCGRLDFEDFWVNHDAGNVWKIDFPRAVQVVVVVAAVRIIEAGRLNVSIAGDFPAADDARSTLVFDKVAIVLFFLRKRLTNSQKRKWDLKIRF